MLSLTVELLKATGSIRYDIPFQLCIIQHCAAPTQRTVLYLLDCLYCVDGRNKPHKPSNNHAFVLVQMYKILMELNFVLIVLYIVYFFL